MQQPMTDPKALAGLSVLALGTYRTDLHPRVAVLIDGLRRHGADVVEVNEPLPVDTAGKVRLLQRPWLAGAAAWQLVRCWARLVRRGARLRGTGVDVVLVGYMGHFDVHLARALFPRATLVLDQLVFARDTAVDRGSTRRWLLFLLGALDRAAVGRADVVVLDTEENRDLLPSAGARKAVVVPVGATDDWFAAGDRTPVGQAGADGPAGLSVVFFGLFTPLQGAATVARAAAKLATRPAAPPVRFTLVGRGQDLAEARHVAGGLSTVEWVEWVQGDRLPGLVAGHDVCLGIFGATAKASRVVPTKVYQGAAAGCAVVTSRTPPQERVLMDAAVFVPAADPGALADALERLAGSPEALRAARARMRAVAVARFSTVEVTSTLAEVLRRPGA